MTVEASHWQRNDVALVTIEYEDGAVYHYVPDQNVDKALVRQLVNNSTEKIEKHRQQWTEIEVHIKGHKRPLKKG